MAVASTKSRWETGEVQAQSTAKGPSCKVTSIPGDVGSPWYGKGESTQAEVCIDGALGYFGAGAVLRRLAPRVGGLGGPAGRWYLPFLTPSLGL